MTKKKLAEFVARFENRTYDWTKIYPETFSFFYNNPTLNAYFRVLMLLANTMQFGSLSLLKAAEIREILGFKRVTVYKALADLKRDGLIRTDSYQGRPGYRVNPNLFHKGSNKHRGTEVARWSAQDPLFKPTLRDVLQDPDAAVEILNSVLLPGVAEQILAAYNRVLARKVEGDEDALLAGTLSSKDS